MAELHDDCICIAADTPGHGKSDAPVWPYSLGEMAEDFAEFTLALVGPSLVVGCSMGSMIAQGMCVSAPNSVRGAVFANAAHLRTPETRAMMERRAEAALLGMSANLKPTLSRWFLPEYRQAHPEKVQRVAEWLLQSDPCSQAGSWRAIRDLNFANGLKTTSLPCMTIGGAFDQATPTSAMKSMAQDIPGCVYREIAAGHLSPYEDPVGFANLIREALRRTSS